VTGYPGGGESSFQCLKAGEYGNVRSRVRELGMNDKHVTRVFAVALGSLFAAALALSARAS
jgi:hypothetical protein